LTLGYVLLTLIGMLHTWARFAVLGINVFHYAEVGDFVLAPLRDPLLVAVTLLPILLISLYMRVAESWGDRRRARKAERGQPIRLWERKSPRWLWVVLFVLWVLAFGLHYANWTADRLRAGHGLWVEVRLAGEDLKAPTPLTGIQIGTTQSYLFLFDPRDGRREAIPVENIERIVFLKGRKAIPGAP